MDKKEEERQAEIATGFIQNIAGLRESFGQDIKVYLIVTEQGITLGGATTLRDYDMPGSQEEDGGDMLIRFKSEKDSVKEASDMLPSYLG